jgi:hypothetical protein
VPRMSSQPLLRAAALDVWVAARERAIEALKAETLRLEQSGANSKAAHLAFAARHLSLHLDRERAEAQALRAGVSNQPFKRISLQ